MRMFFLFCISVSILPNVLFAQVLINEIMYDLEGADSGREWIEIYNGSGETIDLSTWRLFEGDVNHKLIPIQGDGMLSFGEYAIVADNANTFLIGWPHFKGLLFDSSFSLHNAGETLVLRNNDLTDSDTVSYQSEWGASEDGNSLSRVGEKWIAATPTPGSKNANVSAPVSSDEEMNAEEDEGSHNTNQNKIQPSFSTESHIIADAGEDRTVVVGADTVFEAKATGLVGKPLTGARFVWNFGDGETKEGQNVFHYYRYPGTYVAVLDASSGEYVASDRVVVTAAPVDVSISLATTERILIENKDNREINLSWWFLESEKTRFMIPKGTIILPGGTLSLSAKTTGLTNADQNNTTLHYPNGVLAYVFVPEPTPTQIVQHNEAPTERSVATTYLAQSPIVDTGVSVKNSVKKVEEQDLLGNTPPSFPSSIHQNQTAAVASERSSLTPWIIALVGILTLSVIAVVGIKRTRSLSDDIELIP